MLTLILAASILVLSGSPPSAPASGTSYANAGGSGDRTATITIADNGITTGAGAFAFINGTQADQSWFNVTAVAGNYLRFDFGTPKVIDEVKFYQDTSDSQGTWEFQGSADASTWTTLGSSFTLGGTTTQTITAPSGNTTAYQYYQLIGISGTSSSGPYVREIEFKIQ